MARRGTSPAIGFITRVSALSSKGQATIPVEIRRELGLEPGNFVAFSIKNGEVTVKKAQGIDDAWNAAQSAMLSEWNDPDLDIYND